MHYFIIGSVPAPGTHFSARLNCSNRMHLNFIKIDPRRTRADETEGETWMWTNVSCYSCAEVDEFSHPLRMKLREEGGGRARAGSELGSHRLPTNIILHLLTLSDIQFLGSQCEGCLQIVSIAISDVWPLVRA